MPKNHPKKPISASEIGQYAFCSLAWKLQQQGYAPDPRVFEKGIQHHNQYGTTLKKYNKHRSQSLRLYLLGLLLLLIGIILIIGGMTP